MSFILLNAVVLINVVVAVLLEKMVDDEGDGDEPGASVDGTPGNSVGQNGASGRPELKTSRSFVIEQAAENHIAAEMVQMRREMRHLQETLDALMKRMEDASPFASVDREDLEDLKSVETIHPGDSPAT